jgi:hypothetical protein
MSERLKNGSNGYGRAYANPTARVTLVWLFALLALALVLSWHGDHNPEGQRPEAKEAK